MKNFNHPYDYYEHKIINNFKDYLELAKNDYNKKIAYSFYKDEERITKTFNDVYSETLKLTSYFIKNYKNKHIALIGENSYNWIITFLAIVLSGNICVVLDKDLNKEELSNLMKASDTDIIYYSKKYCSFIDELKFKSYPIDSIEDYFKEEIDINKIKVNNTKDAVIFFTSGTTGPNKPVLLSQKSIARNIYGASSLFVPYGSVVAFLPFHHAFGLITGILKAFYYGVEVYINHSLKYLVDDFKREKPEIVFAVPAFIEMFYKIINRKLKEHNIDIDHLNFFVKRKVRKEFGGKLEYIICGGAPLDEKYIKWFRTIGIEILNGYGITECSPVVSVNRNNYHKDGSVGVPCRDVEVKIIDEEICIKGDILMNGYYKNEKETKEIIKNGYLHTGDIGYIDDDGFIFITGRKKNIIILSNGENISPELIEKELKKDNAVEEVIVCESDNKLTAVIYPNSDYLNNEEYFDNLIYEYNKDKAKNHQVTNIILRDKEFIKNNNGKIIRAKALED